MKILFLFACLCLLQVELLAQTDKTTGFAWKKNGFLNTQLYMFRLPTDIDPNNIIATIKHKKRMQLPETFYCNGKKIKRPNKFIYINQPTDILYNTKLPFTLPANTWVWAFNYADEIIIADENLQVNIKEKKYAPTKYQLPANFDLLSNKVVSLQEYMTAMAEKREAMFVWTLSLQQISTPKNFNAIFTDTTIAIVVKDTATIPEVLKNYFYSSCAKMPNNHQCDIEINNALLMKGKLYFVKQVFKSNSDSAKNIIPHPNVAKTICYYSLDGDTCCRSSGGFVGPHGCIESATAPKYKVMINIKY